MPTHLKRESKNEIYFITFSCHKWLPLIDESNTYSYCEKWFEYLVKNECEILGYVIMPNHFHGLFYLKESSNLNLNKLIANGKRFWAYEIVKQLEKLGEHKFLHFIQMEVSLKESKIGKKHEIFNPSFDSKICYSRKMVETKLEYMHHNPMQGKWRLAKDFTEYPYSSAAFYELQKPNLFVKHYMDII